MFCQVRFLLLLLHFMFPHLAASALLASLRPKREARGAAEGHGGFVFPYPWHGRAKAWGEVLLPKWLAGLFVMEGNAV